LKVTRFHVHALHGSCWYYLFLWNDVWHYVLVINFFELIFNHGMYYVDNLEYAINGARIKFYSGNSSLWWQGWLSGLKADGEANQLPTIAIVASYDTFGAAPVSILFNFNKENQLQWSKWRCEKFFIHVGFIGGQWQQWKWHCGSSWNSQVIFSSLLKS